jgi:hypothetical protein
VKAVAVARALVSGSSGFSGSGGISRFVGEGIGGDVGGTAPKCFLCSINGHVMQQLLRQHAGVRVSVGCGRGHVLRK